MKKLENFMYRYSWLLKLGIFISIFLWAAQGNVLVKKMYEIYKEENAAYDSEDQAAKSKAVQELDNYARNLINEASTLSRQDLYGPKEYFNDLKKIWLKNKDLYHAYLPISGFAMTSLQGMSLPEGLMRASKEKIKELEESRDDYRQWLKTADVYKDSTDETFIHEGEKKFNWKEDSKSVLNWFRKSVLNWFVTLYLRAFLFIILLYLIRMSQRKGILETILADKKKFTLAVLAWPVFISKYPYNVVREIIVEAELRRLGNVFRKLSPKEKLKIQSIANSDGCSGWLKNFQTENRLRFQNSFLFALAVATTLHALFPVLASSAETHLARGDPLMMEQVAEDMITDFSGSDCPDDGADSACILEAPYAVALYVSEKLKIISEMARRVRRSKKIDRVPLEQLFSGEVLIPN